MNSEKDKIDYFKRFSLRKTNILKFAGEILCLPLEITPVTQTQYYKLNYSEV